MAEQHPPAHLTASPICPWTPHTRLPSLHSKALGSNPQIRCYCLNSLTARYSDIFSRGIKKKSEREKMSLEGEISCYMFCLIGPFNLNLPENSHWKRLEFLTSLGEKDYIYIYVEKLSTS